MKKNLKLKLNVLFILSLVVVLLSVISCTSKKTESIKIGTILGLTGDNAAYGQKMQRGFEFALEDINKEGAINGKKIQLITEDSQFDPSKAVTAYQKLLGTAGVRIIVGITGSKNALPVCEASKNDNVVIIDALGSAPKLTTNGGPNYFRVMASDALAGKFNVDWALESGMKKPAIVYIEDEWGTSYRDALLDYLHKKGFDNVPVHGVNAETRDFRVQVEKIKNEKPDSLFFLVYAKEGSVFVKQLRELGVTSQIYGSDNISSPEFTTAGRGAIEGVRIAMPAPANGQTFEDFVSRYKTKYGEAPDANVIKSYDAMKLTAFAIRKVGEDPAKIRAYFHSPEFMYKGVSGDIKFDMNGDLVKQEYSKMIYRAGELVALK